MPPDGPDSSRSGSRYQSRVCESRGGPVSIQEAYHFTQLFVKYDEDESGAIDSVELRNLLACEGLLDGAKGEQLELARCMSAVDSNANGQIERLYMYVSAL